MTRFRASMRSPRAGYTGKLFAGDPRLPVDEWGIPKQPQGIFISLEAGNAAGISVVVGTDGGATSLRKFTLMPGGIWLSCVGWSRVEVTVDIVSGVDVEVSAGWLRESPDRQRPLLIQAIDSTALPVPVPAGARRVALSAAAAGFIWRSRPSGVNLDIPATFAAVGTFADVCGAEYVNNVAGLVGCWEIDGF